VAIWLVGRLDLRNTAQKAPLAANNVEIATAK
jgi:hypothetical protein